MDLSKFVINIAGNAINSNEKLRNEAAKTFDKVFYNKIVKNENSMYSENARLIQYDGVKSIYKGIIRNMNKGYISKDFTKKVMKPLIDCFIPSKEMKQTINEFKNKHGFSPSTFIVISPTKKCNLKCVGCYASCDNNHETLDYKTVSEIIRQCHDELGIRFFVISGGEPFEYKSEGKTILDLPKEHPDCLFLMYTNGTMISKEIAKQLATLGNLTPAISVEGYEKETDDRRGKGIYKVLLNAMSNLREAGVPFGVSVTATSKNAELLMTDEFYDKYFESLGATYMWMFQFCP
jgi:uncharacterized Fe-S cluster-containing radical SAM superfamily protein